MPLQITDHDLSNKLEFEHFEERVKILQRILAANCSDPKLQKIKREIIPGHSESQLLVEKILYEKLIRRLTECRDRLNPTTTSTTSTTTSKPVPFECRTAINLTEKWRTDTEGGSLKPIVYNISNCDTRQMAEGNNPWFRFVGEAGNRLLDTCPQPMSCGSSIGIWSDSPMPENVGEVADIIGYGSWVMGCKQYNVHIIVMRCSTLANDFIYNPTPTNVICGNSFCGMSG